MTNSFSNYNISLYVPEGSVGLYQTTSPWSNFKDIKPLSEVSPENKMAYSQMHLVFELIKSMDEEKADKNIFQVKS